MAVKAKTNKVIITLGLKVVFHWNKKTLLNN